jgi:hypothetical protein
LPKPPRCIFVGKRLKRFVDEEEANLDKNLLPRDQKPPKKVYPTLTHPPHT